MHFQNFTFKPFIKQFVQKLFTKVAAFVSKKLLSQKNYKTSVRISLKTFYKKPESLLTMQKFLSKSNNKANDIQPF